ncbi:MAG: hypothetical protein IT331_00255 [Anaerolineae bacterium]|nr:hypothetical protein [Anaerolineae bacterium]
MSTTDWLADLLRRTQSQPNVELERRFKDLDWFYGPQIKLMQSVLERAARSYLEPIASRVTLLDARQALGSEDETPQTIGISLAGGLPVASAYRILHERAPGPNSVNRVIFRAPESDRSDYYYAEYEKVRALARLMQEGFFQHVRNALPRGVPFDLNSSVALWALTEQVYHHALGAFLHAGVCLICANDHCLIGNGSNDPIYCHCSTPYKQRSLQDCSSC